MSQVCHVIYGSTYDHKYLMGQMKFRFHYGDKVWVRFSSPYTDLAKEIEQIKEEISEIQSINHTTVDLKVYQNTSVDPYVSTFGRDCPKTSFTPPKVRQAFDFHEGDQLELSGYQANYIQKQLGMDLFFRNIELVEVIDENKKYVEAKFKFISTIAQSCHCCGRSLEDEVSVSSGVGPVCAKKYLGLKKVTKADAAIIMARIDELSNEIGVVGPVRIYKNRIKTRLEKPQEEVA